MMFKFIWIVELMVNWNQLVIDSFKVKGPPPIKITCSHSHLEQAAYRERENIIWLSRPFSQLLVNNNIIIILISRGLVPEVAMNNTETKLTILKNLKLKLVAILI